MDKISLSEDFNAQLAKRMEREKASESRRHIKLAATIVASAACMALIIGAVFTIISSDSLILNSDSADKAGGESAEQMEEDDCLENDTVENEGAMDLDSDIGYDICNDECNDESFCEAKDDEMSDELAWCGDGLTDRQALEVLAERLKNDTERLYVSQTETFDGGYLLSEAEISELVSKIENSEATDLCGEAAENYLALFSDGTTARFTLCSDNTLYINGIETVFKF